MHQNGFNVLGTSPLMIDAAEDRYKFSQVVRTLHVMIQRIRKHRIIDRGAKHFTGGSPSSAGQGRRRPAGLEGAARL